jgi:general secretion pathway protein L
MHSATPVAYVRWWLDETRAWLADTAGEWFAGDDARSDLCIDADGLHVVNLEGARARVVSSVTTGEAATSPVLRKLIAGGRDRVRLVLRDPQVLVRSLSLPAAIEENLAEAVGFEIDRVTPFKADQIYFTAQVVERDAQKETVEVELVLVPKVRADAWLEAARQAGLTVAEMVPEPALVRGRPVNLLPARLMPPRKWGRRTRWNLALLAATIVLGLVAILLPVWQKRERVIDLIPLASKAAAEFEVNRKIYDEYARLAGEYNHIASRKHGAQSLLAVIEEVTRISPDTTFAQTFELKTSGKVRELVMMGEAASASKVIESLEQSPLFQNATQRAQTTRGSQVNTERFHIATEVKPRPVPAALLPSEAPPAAPPAPSVPPATPSPQTPSPISAAPSTPDPRAAGVEGKTAAPEGKAGAAQKGEALSSGQALTSQPLSGTPLAPPAPTPPVKGKP